MNLNEPPFSLGQLRMPPHSIEAEASVLGGLLLNNQSWDRVGDLLSPDDFFRHEHQLIYEAIGQMVNANHEADVVTVFEHLERAGQGKEVGGLTYINSLAQGVPNAGNIRRYAELVRERSILRQLGTVGDTIAASAFAPDGRPVQALLEEAETRVLAIAESGGRIMQSFQSSGNLVVKLLDRIEELADDPREVTGTPTGFYDLDRMLSGLQPGDLVVLAARPSMGKTALALNIAEHVAIVERLPVAVFSMEMGSMQLMLRMVGSIGRIDHQRLRSGRLTDEEWSRLPEAVEKLRDIELHIEETPGLLVGELRSKARRLARQVGGKLGLIVVDYLQLMSTTSKDENRATAIGEITRGLKMLAKEMGCPVVALSQLSRGVESRSDKRPMMSDLRESGAIEQDADVIMFIYRDDYYNPDSKEPGVAELIVSKQRNGPTGTLRLAFLKEMTRFESLASSAYQ